MRDFTSRLVVRTYLWYFISCSHSTDDDDMPMTCTTSTTIYRVQFLHAIYTCLLHEGAPFDLRSTLELVFRYPLFEFLSVKSISGPWRRCAMCLMHRLAKPNAHWTSKNFQNPYARTYLLPKWQVHNLGEMACDL